MPSRPLGRVFDELPGRQQLFGAELMCGRMTAAHRSRAARARVADNSQAACRSAVPRTRTSPAGEGRARASLRIGQAMTGFRVGRGEPSVSVSTAAKGTDFGVAKACTKPAM